MYALYIKKNKPHTFGDTHVITVLGFCRNYQLPFLVELSFCAKQKRGNICFEMALGRNVAGLCGNVFENISRQRWAIRDRIINKKTAKTEKEERVLSFPRQCVLAEVHTLVKTQRFVVFTYTPKLNIGAQPKVYPTLTSED